MDKCSIYQLYIKKFPLDLYLPSSWNRLRSCDITTFWTATAAIA